MNQFWNSFEKEAKKKKITRSKLLEEIRKGRSVKFKGHSIAGLSQTRIGKILRGLK